MLSFPVFSSFLWCFHYRWVEVGVTPLDAGSVMWQAHKGSWLAWASGCRREEACRGCWGLPQRVTQVPSPTWSSFTSGGLLLFFLCITLRCPPLLAILRNLSCTLKLCEILVCNLEGWGGCEWSSHTVEVLFYVWAATVHRNSCFRLWDWCGSEMFALQPVQMITALWKIHCHYLPSR